MACALDPVHLLKKRSIFHQNLLEKKSMCRKGKMHLADMHS